MNALYEEIPVNSGEFPKVGTNVGVTTNYKNQSIAKYIGNDTWEFKRQYVDEVPTSWLRKLPLDVSVERETAIERMIEFINGMLKIEDDLIVKYKDNLSAVADIKTNWQQLNKIKEIALSLQKQQSESSLSSPTGTAVINMELAGKIWDAAITFQCGHNKQELDISGNDFKKAVPDKETFLNSLSTGTQKGSEPERGWTINSAGSGNEGKDWWTTLEEHTRASLGAEFYGDDFDYNSITLAQISRIYDHKASIPVKVEEGWIKVEDGLPELETKILVLRPNRDKVDTLMGYLHDSGETGRSCGIRGGGDWLYGKYWSLPAVVKFDTITHWQPLPAPPKQ